MVRVVASYGRRRRLAEEVPGLNIRRLTLEDPRSAKERSSGSRSRTPPRHICHPGGPYVSSSFFFSSRGSSRYFPSEPATPPLIIRCVRVREGHTGGYRFSLLLFASTKLTRSFVRLLD